MRAHRIRMALGTTLLALVASMTAAAPPASAHGEVTVGRYATEVGWAEEPVYTGFRNAALLVVKDPAGKPVTDLGDELKVEVVFGDQKLGPLTFEPAFGGGEGTPGEYHAPFIPTRAGQYTFRLVGAIKGQPVDQQVTKDQGLEPVEDPSEVEFPAKDPSRADLAQRVDRLAQRVDPGGAAGSPAASTKSGSDDGRHIAIAAVVIAIVAVVVSLMSRRRPAGPAA